MLTLSSRISYPIPMALQLLLTMLISTPVNIPQVTIINDNVLWPMIYSR